MTQNRLRKIPRKFIESGYTLKNKSQGHPRIEESPEKVAMVRNSFQQSPPRSSRKHAAAIQ